MVKQITPLVAAIVFVAGCGGGSSSGSGTGIINLAITDAAHEDVSAVNVQFAGVHLKPQSGEEIAFDFAVPEDIDLLTLQDGITAGLLDGAVVPAGRYNWIRLAVNAEADGVFDSYVMIDGAMKELRIPSGSQSGLKLVSGFTVLEDQSIDLIIDWVLSKALSYPSNDPTVVHLRPALRITDMAMYGTLAGTVTEELVSDPGCTNDPAMDTGSAVYVFGDFDQPPADINAGAATDPIVTAPVKHMEGTYAFEIHYMPVGDYTVAFTCHASDDESETAQAIEFAAQTNATIFDGETTTIELPPPPPPE